jgi:hypothetical protein
LQEAARGGVVVAGPHIDQAAGPLDGAARKAPLDALGRGGLGGQHTSRSGPESKAAYTNGGTFGSA